MLYQKKGDTVLAGGKTFTVGGEVFANYACAYEGLFGIVTEIRTGPDQKTERDGLDICCTFYMPESESLVEDIKARFSSLHGYPKQMEELRLDGVILEPGMLEPLPEKLPAAEGELYSLTCFCDSDDSCSAQVLALSNDVGTLLRKMREDLDTYEIPMVLSHVERRIDGYRFAYEAKETGVESLYLDYTISSVSVLFAPMGSLLSQPQLLCSGEVSE